MGRKGLGGGAALRFTPACCAPPPSRLRRAARQASRSPGVRVPGAGAGRDWGWTVRSRSSREARERATSYLLGGGPLGPPAPLEGPPPLPPARRPSVARSASDPTANAAAAAGARGEWGSDAPPARICSSMVSAIASVPAFGPGVWLGWGYII